LLTLDLPIAKAHAKTAAAQVWPSPPIFG